MVEAVLGLFEKEDLRNPYSDRQVAELAGTTREKVTEIRKKYGILNSRDRLKPVIESDAKKLMEKRPGLSHRALMKELNEMGYDISRQVALNLMGEISRPAGSARKLELTEEKSTEQDQGFQEIVGYDRSLKMQISQAKAAVLYPPKGMHTLIIGESGVGKSQLAEAMYHYAIQTPNFTETSPFVSFNCADYAENPQLLLSQLFGYVKGAFTGAEKEKDGIIELANEGILFLDEVHRLPSEGQEILFTILDKGTYRKLGETMSERRATIMIIAATSENHNSTLLTTFRRRIPMVIELPALVKRTTHERYQLIKQFFSEEAKKISKDIYVEKDTLRMLMVYECAGNIGQLRSDIQVACARALLNTMIKKRELLIVHPMEVANHVKIGMLDKDVRSEKVRKYVTKDMLFSHSDETRRPAGEGRYEFSDWIYRFIEERSGKLESDGLTPNEINTVISRELEKKFEELSRQTEALQPMTRGEMKNLVGVRIAKVLDTCQSIAEGYFDGLQDSFYYTLGIHLSATYERLLDGKEIQNPHLTKVKEEYVDEYKVAQILGEVVQQELDIVLPEDEIGFIAMYLKTFSSASIEKQGRVAVVILTHGLVGKSIADVANKLLNTNHAVGVEMSLTESPQAALEKTIRVIKEQDQGKGCALLVDMGSLVVFGDLITKQTGIPVRVVKRVDTLMALEVIRRATLVESDLDEVIRGLTKEESIMESEPMEQKRSHLPKAIVTVCMTGEGAAKKMENFVREFADRAERNIHVISIGLISMVSMDVEIQQIAKKYEIIAFVGTLNPEYRQIPFLSIQSLYTGDGLSRLSELIQGVEMVTNVEDILDDQLIFYNISFQDKSEAIEFLADRLLQRGYVDEGFLLSVYRREAITPTFFKGNIAAPHGLPKHVTKPVIAIAKLKTDIVWANDNPIDIIFMIAYKNDSKKYFKNFYRILLNAEVIDSIRNCQSADEIKALVIRNYGFQ